MSQNVTFLACRSWRVKTRKIVWNQSTNLNSSTNLNTRFWIRFNDKILTRIDIMLTFPFRVYKTVSHKLSFWIFTVIQCSTYCYRQFINKEIESQRLNDLLSYVAHERQQSLSLRSFDSESMMLIPKLTHRHAHYAESEDLRRVFPPRYLSDFMTSQCWNWWNFWTEWGDVGTDLFWS